MAISSHNVKIATVQELKDLLKFVPKKDSDASVSCVINLYFPDNELYTFMAENGINCVSNSRIEFDVNESGTLTIFIQHIIQPRKQS